MVTLIRRSALGVTVLCVFAGIVGVPAASAEGLAPWWGLTAGERPTNLRPGVAKDAVLKLKVKAGAGEYALIEKAALEREELTNEKGELNRSVVAFVNFNAPASVVQKGFEAIFGGAHKVVVSGGPGSVSGSEAYVVTFPGQEFCPPGTAPGRLGVRFCVPLPIAFGGLPGAFGGTSLSGGSEENSEASIVEVSRGGPTADGQLVVDAQNLGDTSTSGTVTVTDQLPAGLNAVAIEGEAGGPGGTDRGPVSCTLQTLTCTYGDKEYVKEEKLGEGKKLIPESLPPYEQIEVRISVEVQPGARSGEQNTATVSGGAAASARTASHPIEVNGTEKFGVEDYQLIPENDDGSVDTQAGSHPFQFTNITTFNSTYPDSQRFPRTAGLPKDVIGELPTGFIGNPTPFTQCTDVQFAKKPPPTPATGERFINECPVQSAIGIAVVTYTDLTFGLESVTTPIFNLKPLPGEPARFGFKPLGAVPVFLDASVRTGSDYGVTITSSNIIQKVSLLGVKLTFWGVPGDPRHDPERGWECLQHFGTCATSSATSPPPFLLMPTSCEAPYETTVHADSWGSPGRAGEQAEPVTYKLPLKLDGCNHLPFAPSITVAPDVPNGSTSTGLTTDVHVSQTAALNPEGLAESAVRDITVTLPEGVALNPAGADGLGSCSPAQVGFTRVNPETNTAEFTSGPASCPNAAKIGEVTVSTPLLPNKLTGSVYLASPQNFREGPPENPFGSLIAMYLVAEDPVSGTLIKLPGEVSLNQATGQITATFKNSPQLPFEDAVLHFYGGERAPLATPSHCGSYTTQASFVPWSGNPPVGAQSSFNITTGPNGGPCPGAALPFAATLAAGTTNINAASFSTLTTTISRNDGQQNIQTVQLHMPPGLSGILSGVKLCPEAQANAGTCGQESLIGSTVVSVGLGGDPFSVTGGQVFLTEHYAGAPFGLSIVNPAKAGPFDLGKVIVRARIEVDPHTAELTITTDGSGPHAIPHILDGIPLEIKHVNVTVDRPGFTFNPTNCNPLQVTGNIASAEGASSPVQVPFQVTNCATLKFAPKFSVSTSGKTSRSKGASLIAKLAYPNAPQGTQTNITRVKVALPKQLPSRLTTLQKACTNAQFEANPANCPSASKIGFAKVTTPLLPVPLEGPAIFVSHGGEAFPSLTLVLQGYGVTVDLVGSTFISKQGITSTTFKTVPDVPFNQFQLTLPEGKFSALAANGNLCKSKLVMPTEFVAQNGLKIHQATKVSVTGCAKTKKATKHKRHKGRGKTKKGKGK